MEIAKFAAEYWLGAAFAVLAAVLTGGFHWARRKFKEAKEEQGVVKKGVQALLRDRIVQAHNHYLDKEFCPIYALENVHAMYKEYTALGGNGAVKILVEEMERMPKKKEESQ